MNSFHKIWFTFAIELWFTFDSKWRCWLITVGKIWQKINVFETAHRYLDESSSCPEMKCACSQRSLILIRRVIFPSWWMLQLSRVSRTVSDGFVSIAQYDELKLKFHWHWSSIIDSYNWSFVKIIEFSHLPVLCPVLMICCNASNTISSEYLC